MLYIKLNIQRFADDGVVTIGLKMDSKSFEAQIEDVEKQLIELDKEYAMISKEKPYKGQERALREIRLEAEKLNNKLANLRKQQLKLNETHLFEGMGTSIKKIIRKVTKWGLAVFGIRSAYMAVRNAINTIAGDDKQLAADIEYMKAALAYSLEPVVRGIVELAKQLMYYIRYIIREWFNYDIFANANKSLKNANKQADKLKKTLASFDEINILNDKNDNETVLPSFDLTKDDIPIPWWVDWIARNKGLLTKIAEVIGLFIATSTVTKILKNIGLLMGSAGGTGLVGLSEILALIGTVYLVTIAIKGTKDVISQINEVNNSIINLTSGTKKLNDKNAELYQKFQNLYKQGKLTTEQIDTYRISLENTIDRTIDAINQTEGMKKNWLGKLEIKELNEAQKAYVERLKDTTDAYKFLYDQGLLNDEQQKTYKILLEKVMTALSNQGIEVEDLRQDYLKLTGKTYEIKIEAKADTKQASKDYSNFFTKLGESVSTVLNPLDWGSGFFSKIKNIWNGGSTRSFAKGGVVLPKLAKGGIANYPGKGIPTMDGGARWAEAGAEAYLPLTDSQQMALLGEAIGKYITINLTNVNQMNGRVISRELAKVQNESDFAFNR